MVSEAEDEEEGGEGRGDRADQKEVVGNIDTDGSQEIGLYVNDIVGHDVVSFRGDESGVSEIHPDGAGAFFFLADDDHIPAAATVGHITGRGDGLKNGEPGTGIKFASGLKYFAQNRVAEFSQTGNNNCILQVLVGCLLDGHFCFGQGLSGNGYLAQKRYLYVSGVGDSISEKVHTALGNIRHVHGAASENRVVHGVDIGIGGDDAHVKDVGRLEPIVGLCAGPEGICLFDVAQVNHLFIRVAGYKQNDR